MELNLEHFKSVVGKEEILYLGTSSGNDVSIRPISPHIMDGLTIYFYTGNQSEKYRQMKDNPNIAFCIGPQGSYQGKGSVRFLGSIFDDAHEALRKSYKQKYKEAFEVAAPGEVMENNEFMAIDIKLLKGWVWDEKNEFPLGLAEMKF